MHYFFQPLTHIRNISRWARAHGARHRLDVETFQMEVDFKQQVLTLEPRFLIKTAGGLAYSPSIGRIGSFVGWLPYSLKRWPIAGDKLKFKEYCENNDLPMPSYWFQGEAPASDFIIKDRKGSFGQGIRGPFRREHFSDISDDIRAGAYCEEFIDGDAIKIWYWNDSPIFLERLPPRFLVGDGIRSIRDIAVTTRGSFDTSFEVGPKCDDYLAWQGMTADSIPKAGEQVKLAYPYTSDFDAVTVSNRDVLQKQSQKLRDELDRFGKVLCRAIPPEIRQHVLFTLDAVATDKDEIFLLEVNCNPMVHPLSYVFMLDNIFQVTTPPLQLQPAIHAQTSASATSSLHSQATS